MLPICEVCKKEKAIAIVMRKNPIAEYPLYGKSILSLPEYYFQIEFHICKNCLVKLGDEPNHLYHFLKEKNKDEEIDYYNIWVPEGIKCIKCGKELHRHCDIDIHQKTPHHYVDIRELSKFWIRRNKMLKLWKKIKQNNVSP